MEISHSLLARITLNPDVCFGKPTVRNLRYPVETRITRQCYVRQIDAVQ